MEIFNIRQIAKNKILEKDLDPSVINLLLEHVLGLSNQEILMKNILDLDEDKTSRFFSLLEEYLKNERPIQYILGYTYFYKRKFIVNKNVLIPRFETEELVYHALKIIKENNYKNIADIGSGSGNINIKLKLENENLNVMGLDISNDALDVSKENAFNLNANINYYESDLLSYLIDNNIKVDLIISNPPYIDINDNEVDDIVRNNEPSLALFASDNGLYNYKKIIDDSKKVLNKNGSIIFEIGYTQGNILKEYALNKYQNIEVEIIKDIDKKDRILFIKFND
jgi:release factor glutamine methyltransferase